jgi:hypothetical protein
LADRSSSQQLLFGPQFISIAVDPAARIFPSTNSSVFLTQSHALFAHPPQLCSNHWAQSLLIALLWLGLHSDLSTSIVFALLLPCWIE